HLWARKRAHRSALQTPPDSYPFGERLELRAELRLVIPDESLPDDSPRDLVSHSLQPPALGRSQPARKRCPDRNRLRLERHHANRQRCAELVKQRSLGGGHVALRRPRGGGGGSAG